MHPYLALYNTHTFQIHSENYSDSSYVVVDCLTPDPSLALAFVPMPLLIESGLPVTWLLITVTKHHVTSHTKSALTPVQLRRLVSTLQPSFLKYTRLRTPDATLRVRVRVNEDFVRFQIDGISSRPFPFLACVNYAWQ